MHKMWIFVLWTTMDIVRLHALCYLFASFKLLISVISRMQLLKDQFLSYISIVYWSPVPSQMKQEITSHIPLKSVLRRTWALEYLIIRIEERTPHSHLLMRRHIMLPLSLYKELSWTLLCGEGLVCYKHLIC